MKSAYIQLLLHISGPLLGPAGRPVAHHPHKILLNLLLRQHQRKLHRPPFLLLRRPSQFRRLHPQRRPSTAPPLVNPHSFASGRRSPPSPQIPRPHSTNRRRRLFLRLRRRVVHLDIIIVVFRDLLAENRVLHLIGLGLEIKHELFPDGVDPLVAEEESRPREARSGVGISERRRVEFARRWRSAIFSGGVGGVFGAAEVALTPPLQTRQHEIVKRLRSLGSHSHAHFFLRTRKHNLTPKNKNKKKERKENSDECIIIVIQNQQSRGDNLRSWQIEERRKTKAFGLVSRLSPRCILAGKKRKLSLSLSFFIIYKWGKNEQRKERTKPSEAVLTFGFSPSRPSRLHANLRQWCVRACFPLFSRVICTYLVFIFFNCHSAVDFHDF